MRGTVLTFFSQNQGKIETEEMDILRRASGVPKSEHVCNGELEDVQTEFM